MRPTRLVLVLVVLVCVARPAAGSLVQAVMQNLLHRLSLDQILGNRDQFQKSVPRLRQPGSERMSVPANFQCACQSDTLLAITTQCHYNTTRKMLKSLQTISVDTVVFDDQSADGTAAKCRSEFPNVRVIVRPGPPKGLTWMWNLAYRTFCACACYRFFVIANNDVQVPQGMIAELTRVMDRTPEADMMGPQTTKQGLGGAGNWDPQKGIYRFQDISQVHPEYRQVRTNADLLEMGSIDQVQQLLLRPDEHNRTAVHQSRGLLGYFMLFERKRAKQKELDGGLLFDPKNKIIGQEKSLVEGSQQMRAFVCTTCFAFHLKVGRFASHTFTPRLLDIPSPGRSQGLSFSNVGEVARKAGFQLRDARDRMDLVYEAARQQCAAGAER